jgi:hypothetical protein
MIKPRSFKSIMSSIIIFSLSFIISGCILIGCIEKYKDYIPVEATVIEYKVEKEWEWVNDDMNDGRDYREVSHHYITYQYEVNGEIYTSTQNAIPFSVKREGAKKIIEYNPELPGEIKNDLLFASMLIFCIFSGIVVSVSIIEIYIYKRRLREGI